ncbi:hypothetical protein KP509_26G005700 [Ceratopteris richardii]|uniref:Uncharacterized protein n=1 Tax=Ceratopteris richardii TaxID=49495 RepID=A0A8T2RKH2_CERRI|nr:hypothetical protein KP509_26G005700 [Ceratopteris richardii]
MDKGFFGSCCCCVLLPTPFKESGVEDTDGTRRSSSAKTKAGWSSRFFKSCVPLSALERGRCPSGVEGASSHINSVGKERYVYYMSSDSRGFNHPTFLKNAVQSPSTLFIIFLCTLYPNFPLLCVRHRRSIVCKSAMGMNCTSEKKTYFRFTAFSPFVDECPESPLIFATPSSYATLAQALHFGSR